MRDILHDYAERAAAAQQALNDHRAGPIDWEARAKSYEGALLWIRENLHPQALGRAATDAELIAETKQAAPDEIMLPYLLLPGERPGEVRTLYEQFSADRALPRGD